MTVHDGDRHEGVQPAGKRPAGRRRAIVVGGAAGLAAVLGGGAYLVTSVLPGPDATVAQDIRPIVPAEQSVSAQPTAGASESATASGSAAAASPSSATTARSGKPSTSPSPTAEDEAAVRKKVMAAREAAAKDGVPLQRPLTPSPATMRALADVKETSRSLPGGGIMRVISTKGDLSGQREMLWAADAGRPVDGARCTQRFHFSPNGPAVVRPTMLLCWRISAGRSVVVLTIDRQNRPSSAESAAEIDRQWQKLG
jgi:hypothetical protein